jgi:vacuole morphology and inheritance protein 14
VRYYACESLFNITKTVRGAILAFFGDVFVAVCKLVADVDQEVRNGAGLFDRLLKEVVMEAEEVDVERFIPLLRLHMGVPNPYVRQLLVGWITALDSVPGIDMLDYMPDLLEGLFDMLSDVNREIRQQAYAALSEFCDQVAKVPHAEFAERVNFRPMIDVLLAQTGRDKEKFNRVTAVEWLSQFIALGQAELAPVYEKLVAGVLRCLSDPEPEIVDEATRANAELLQLVRATPVRDFDPAPVIRTVTAEATSKDKPTRSAALRWVAMLMLQCPEKVMVRFRAVTCTLVRPCSSPPRNCSHRPFLAPPAHSRAQTLVDDLLAALLGNLTDTNDPDVLKLNLEVLARLSVYDLGFLRGRVLVEVVRLFGDNRPLLESRGSFILRRLCLLLDARIVYLSMARILAGEPNREFAALMVELLNLILLTAVELSDLRDLLRGCAAAGGSGTGAGASAATAAGSSAAASAVGEGSGALVPAGADAEPSDGLAVFSALYRTWCHNPIATFSLCLLAQAYELGARLVTRLYVPRPLPPAPLQRRAPMCSVQ